MYDELLDIERGNMKSCLQFQIRVIIEANCILQVSRESIGIPKYSGRLFEFNTAHASIFL